MATRETITTLEVAVPVAFSPDGALLASAGSSGIELWDVASQEPIALLEGHIDTVYSVSFPMVRCSPPGRLTEQSYFGTLLSQRAG